MHIFGRMDRGGAELRTLDLLEQVDPTRVQMIFATLGVGAGELDGRIRELGATVVPMTMAADWPLRFRSALREHRVDVVHSHVATFSGAILATARLSGVKRRIAHFRSEGDGHPDSARRRAQRAVMRKLLTISATDIIAVSPAALRFAGARSRSRAHTAVIPSGLATDPFRRPVNVDRIRGQARASASTVLAVHIGRSLAEKNRPRALGVLAAGRNDGTDLRLAYVGAMTADEQASLTALATKLGIGEHVSFLGQRDDVPDVLRAADLTLVTSTREGLPGVVLESFAAGTPCVASNLAGVVWVAETLPRIITVGLDEADEHWAAKVRDALALPRDANSRAAALRLIDRSVFSLDGARDAFTQLWTRSDHRP